MGKTLTAYAEGRASRLDYLTGLKGLACVIVAFNHYVGGFINYTAWRDKLYCLFFNGTYMVNLYIILSCFFIAYAYFMDNKRLGKILLTRYFRLSLLIMTVMLLVSGLQHIGAYQYWDKILPFTDSQRKESDRLNYYVVYPASDAVKTAFACLFAGTTKFTFPVWMLPTLFKANMITALICIALEKCRPGCKAILFLATYYLTTKYAGEMVAGCVYGVFLAWICVDYLSKPQEKTRQSKNVNKLLAGGVLYSPFGSGLTTQTQK